MMTKRFKKPVAFLLVVAMVMSILNIEWTRSASAGENATFMALKGSDGDGYYEISTPEQLYWFAGLVNGTLEGVEQNKNAKAVLTADITLNTGVLKDDGSLSTEKYRQFYKLDTNRQPAESF